jgi:hypothetical protein
MRELKRNQIEEAISRVLEPQAPKPSTVIRTRVKRLLDIDRELGRGGNDKERESYAFYRVEPPGSGVEVWFSAYEAFALLVGLLLMGHGWPQSFAVDVLRHVRREMEREHKRVLQLDRKWLFDAEAIRKEARAGDMAVSNRDPVFLIVVPHSSGVVEQQQAPEACAVRRGVSEAFKFVREAARRGTPFTLFELTTLAHQFSDALAKTTPRQRGRSR